MTSRLVHLTLLGSMLPTLLGAQQAPRRVPRVTESAWIRFVTADTAGEGRVIGRPGDTLVVQRGGSTLRLPAMRIDSLWAERHHAGRGALYGAAFLGAIGFLGAFSYGYRDIDGGAGFQGGMTWGVVGLGVGALTGGAIGVLFGAFATEWVPVTP